MPRVTQVPRSEQEIGARLRQYRETTHLTRTAFAIKHNLSSGNLHKYENGWVPLPWKVGDHICKREGLSQRWLATGERPMFPYVYFGPEILSGIPRRALFSVAYKEFLDRKLRSAQRSFSKQLKSPSWKGDHWDSGFLGYIDGENALSTMILPLSNHLLATWFKLAPPDLKGPLLSHVTQSLETFVQTHREKFGSADVQAEFSRVVDAFFANLGDG